jgi:AraC-like DNA-binding protein
MTEVRHWSTDDVRPADRLDYYMEAASSALIPMSVSCRNRSQFSAAFAITELGPLSLLRMTGRPHRVDRGGREISRSRLNRYFLMLNLSSPCTLTHPGRTTLLPGDAVLIDTRRAHSLDVGFYALVTLDLPEEWIRRWLHTSDDMVGRRIPLRSRWGAGLSTFVSQLSPEFAATSPVPANVLADQVGALLAIAASHVSGETKHPTPGTRSLRSRIQDCVAQRCAEVMLTADDVATATGIEAQILHEALASFGESFGTVLAAARVEIAKRMLMSRAFDEVGSEEIAARCGFRDAIHFAQDLFSATGLVLASDRGGQNKRHLGQAESPSRPVLPNTWSQNEHDTP